jgi:hypothetical protein
VNDRKINPEVKIVVACVWPKLEQSGSGLFDEGSLTVFVDYLIRCGVDGAEIENFFEECLVRDIDAIFGVPDEEDYRENHEEHIDFFRKYPRIYYWLISMGGGPFFPEAYYNGDIADKRSGYILKIVKHILERELDLLIADFGRFGQVTNFNEPVDLMYLFGGYRISCISRGEQDCPSSLCDKINQLFPGLIGEKPESASVGIERILTQLKERVKTKQHVKPAKKDFYDKWNELIVHTDALHAEDATEVAVRYADLITEWGERFPAETLLRKEIERNNKACVDGVLRTGNEYAKRVLFAYVYAGFDIAYRVYGDRENTYSGLIMLLSNPEPDNDTGKNDYSLVTDAIKKSMLCPGSLAVKKEILVDILNTVKHNPNIGEKIKKNLAAAGINLFFKKPALKEFLEYKSGNENVLNLTDVPYGLYEKYSKCGEKFVGDEEKARYIMDAVVDYWWYEKNCSNPLMKTVRFKNEDYNRVRGIILEKPTFFPKHYQHNEDMMTDYLFREKTYLSFIEDDDNYGLKSGVAWKRYLQHFMEETYKNFEQPPFVVRHKILKKIQGGPCLVAVDGELLLPLIPQYANYLLTESDRFFSTAIRNRTYDEFTVFLADSRKAQLKKMRKKGYLQQDEVEKLTVLATDKSGNFYAWSDKDIKRCLRPDISDADFQMIRSNMEPEFMANIFKKSILWVIEHRDSELWRGAPWFGMQIFDKSYADCPSIWARHLVRIAKEWNGDGGMLIRICVALGHLRELLGVKVPCTLQEIADRQSDDGIKNVILTQKSLFDYENFNKGHHRSPEIRVRMCKEALIKGQNEAVAEWAAH